MHRDIRINLLPWREQRRQKQKQQFLQVLGGVVAAAVGLLVLAHIHIGNATEQQRARNNFLQDEIAVLDGKIAELRSLQQQRTELLARMQVLQELQGHRPIIVRVFDEVAQTLAARVFFSALSYDGENLQISGVAESNNRISAQLRNLDESAWFDAPNVTAITAAADFGPQASRFELTVVRTAPQRQDQDTRDQEGRDR